MVLVFVTWALIMAGVIPPTPTDVYVTCIVLVALFTPWAAFLDNPGEQRTQVERSPEMRSRTPLVPGALAGRFSVRASPVNS